MYVFIVIFRDATFKIYDVKLKILDIETSDKYDSDTTKRITYASNNKAKRRKGRGKFFFSRNSVTGGHLPNRTILF